MAVVKAFQAIRPANPELASVIAALPYDVYNEKEAREYVKEHPRSFLAIDRAETQFEEGVDPYSAKVYEKARELLWNAIAKGTYIEEDKPCYYIYRLTMNGRTQTGIVACAFIDDYLNNIIKKHENTREVKELDRISHVSVCEAQTGPIFLAYNSNDEINRIVEKNLSNEPIFDFISEDGIKHQGYVISDEKDIEGIALAFQDMKDIYIADGHHRCASAVKVGLQKRKENPGFSKEEEFNYFLSVLFPDDQLKIMDYNRVVKDLNELSDAEFLSRIEECYDVSLIGKQAQYPAHKGEVTMFLHGNWYLLKLREAYVSSDCVEGLDVSLLQNYILSPILGIKNPKTDKRIDFVGGIRGLKELERRAETDCEVAFAMYPTSIQELFKVADAGLLMPPKSTWFEPKLRSGLFIHSIKSFETMGV